MCLSRMEESRRMELHELHIGNGSLCTIYHCLTVTRCDDRICSGLIDSSTSASTHERHLTEIGIYLLSLRIENICPIALNVLVTACHGNTEVVLSNNLHSEVMLLHLNIGIGTHSRNESTLYLSTCIIGMVENTEL